MKKLRGRNPTVAESRIMSNAGIDPKQWLINKIKMKPVNENDTGRLTKYQEKIYHWTFVHREDGTSKTIQIDEGGS